MARMPRDVQPDAIAKIAAKRHNDYNVMDFRLPPPALKLDDNSYTVHELETASTIKITFM